jgi:hypothetical protein
MSGSDWDSYSEPPIKRTIPVWAKFFIGCGVVMLALFGIFVAFAYWAASTGRVTEFLAEKVNVVLEKHWGMMIAVTDAIQNDKDASELYRDNPALVNDYPTEEIFLKNAAAWRAKLVDLPRNPPSFEILDKNDFSVSSGKVIGGKRGKLFEISYKISDETRIRLCWEDEKIVELKIQ